MLHPSVISSSVGHFCLANQVTTEGVQCDFIIETEENDDHFRCRVKKNSVTHVWRTTTFPIEEVNGSRFGTCTCGFPMMMGVPCMHMVVALKSGTVDGLNIEHDAVYL